ncbi:MAG: arylsulfatase [Bacteroidota bacterium]|nr:arylsulfatase [Bacteroidota bacterium]
MMRETKSLFLLAIAILFFSCSKSDERPNIVLIMADDMGFSDIGCYGGEIETPNLDRLASHGIRFTQFYNNARCCPTRAALLTGLYPHQTGLGHMVGGEPGERGYRGEIGRNCVTIAEVVGSSGYSTYMSGKWHVARSVRPEDKSNWPLQRGFDSFFGTITGAGSFYDPATLTYMNDPIEAGPGFYYTDAISDTACTFIESYSRNNEGEPFFLYVAYTAPHWPLHAPEKMILKYQELYEQGWDILREKRFERLKEMDIIGEHLVLSDRDFRVPAWESVEEKEWQARRMATYAAQVDIMDQGIGRIIKTLQKNEHLENTLLFFLSDNGGCAEGWDNETQWIRRYAPEYTFDGVKLHFGNNPSIIPGPDSTYLSYETEWANLSNTPFRWYKHYGHEGGVASPFIMHWPEALTDTSRLREQVSGIIDIMATIVDVTGVEYPKLYQGNTIIPTEGISLVDVATNNSIPDRDTYYFEHEWNRYIRKGKWKLVALSNGDWELYDMERDRTELNDLSDEYPELVEKLRDEWERWAWRTGVLPK